MGPGASGYVTEVGHEQGEDEPVGPWREVAIVVDTKAHRLDEQHGQDFNEQGEQAAGEELAGEFGRSQPSLEYPEVVDEEGPAYEVLGVQESCPGCKQPPHLEGKYRNI